MNRVGRGADQFNLRLPAGMRDHLKGFAEKNGRSMNAEIIVRLDHTISKEHQNSRPAANSGQLVPGTSKS